MPMACASMECECLSILGDDNVSKAVALYLVWFGKTSKHEQDLILMEWYCYARNIGVQDNNDDDNDNNNDDDNNVDNKRYSEREQGHKTTA